MTDAGAALRLAVSMWLLGTMMGMGPARGQSASQNPQGPTRATQLPLTPPVTTTGAVTVTQQTTSSGGGNSVISTTATVNVQAPFNGSAAVGKANHDVLALALSDALKQALRYNLGALTENAAVQQAQGQRHEARSELLPTVNAAVSEEFERLNLRTMGVESMTFPTAVTFNFYDARAARLNESVFDLVRIDNLHSASDNLKAAMKSARDARDLVVLAVAGSYLQIMATEARISAAQAQVETAQAVAQQAQDRLDAGLSPRIDANRSQVQLQTERQRLRSLQADLETRKLRFSRLIGMPPGQRFDIVDNYAYSPTTLYTEETALAQAMKQRSDLQAAEAGVHAAEESLKAAHAERLPNLTVAGDFGAAGRTPSNHSTSVYSAAGTLTIPLYEGGRTRADIEQADAALKLRKSQLENVRGQIDEDVRQAFIDLRSAADQVDVAKSNVSLAEDTLNQSRDRFTAGVTDTVEVVQSEQTAIQADDDYIAAVFQHNLAKVSLARAIGAAEQNLPLLLRK